MEESDLKDYITYTRNHHHLVHLFPYMFFSLSSVNCIYYLFCSALFSQALFLQKQFSLVNLKMSIELSFCNA